MFPFTVLSEVDAMTVTPPPPAPTFQELFASVGLM